LRPTTLAVTRPVAAAVLSLLILVLGGAAALNLPVLYGILARRTLPRAAYARALEREREEDRGDHDGRDGQ
jgi:hypothetical protein